MATSTPFVDYYALLNVPPNAGIAEIKRGYRKVALLNHPDKHTDRTERAKAEDRMKRINAARDCLENPAFRREYDFQWTQHKMASMMQEEDASGLSNNKGESSKPATGGKSDNGGNQSWESHPAEDTPQRTPYDFDDDPACALLNLAEKIQVNATEYIADLEDLEFTWLVQSDEDISQGLDRALRGTRAIGCHAWYFEIQARSLASAQMTALVRSATVIKRVCEKMGEEVAKLKDILETGDGTDRAQRDSAKQVLANWPKVEASPCQRLPFSRRCDGCQMA